MIGTKAQYIKTAPLMRMMSTRGIDYVLIDSGQHAAFSKALRRELEVKTPDSVLADNGNIKTLGAAALWFARQVFTALLGGRQLRHRVFSRGRGVCVIHGDTLSTLIGLMLAKRAGQRIAFIEAGLRSGNFFKPFPEEIIRVICARYSDFLFATSDRASVNLQKMGVPGRIINLGQNTGAEAVYFTLEKAPAETPPDPFALMTIHRFETIFSKRRLEWIVQLARNIATRHRLVFVLHDATVVKLKQYELMEELTREPMIETTTLMGYDRFLRLVEQACYVVTDGGSIQEECFYLDVPCLVLRGETERQEGVGSNVVISGFDDEKIAEFLEQYQTLKHGSRIANIKPSEKILEVIMAAVTT